MMGDLAETIIPKSDQLNADDLIGGPITITVRDAVVKKGDDQPCCIFYDGDNGKPYKPNKGMRRLLMMAWKTDDSKTFIGRSMTLWRNPDVLWAGKKEGGIRISHLSHLSGEETFAVTVSRGKREHITIKPLRIESGAREMTRDEARQLLMDANTLDELQLAWRNKGMAPFRESLSDLLGERKAELAPAETATAENPTASEGRTDEQHGDQHDGSEPDPRRTLADKLIATASKASAMQEILDMSALRASDIAAMPDELRDEVNAAFDAALARIKGNG